MHPRPVTAARRQNQSSLRATLLALALLLPLGAAAAGDGPTCSAPAASAGDDVIASWETVVAARPGPWRREAKRQPARVRVPGTRTLAPDNPLSTGSVTEGRWLPGYRPATPAAQAELEAWQAAQTALLGTGAAGRAPSTSSNYAVNLLAGKRAEEVPHEEITHAVHEQQYDVSALDLRRLGPAGETTDLDEREGEPESEKNSPYDHHSTLTWEERSWVKRQAESAPTTLDAQEAAAEAMNAPGPAGVSFDAIRANSSLVPPDPIIAAGPGHLIALVNSRYQVWDKTGNPLTPPIALDALFSGVPSCAGVFDVFADYDEAANRFVVGGETIGAANDSYLCVAATATNDPTGVWNRTSFRSDSVVPSTFLDYPHMAIGLDAIYISGNMFVDGGAFDSVRLFAVDKNALYQAAPVAVAEAGLGSVFFTAQPAKIHGYTSGGWPAPGTPHHFISHDGGGNGRIWRWSNPFATAPVIYGTFTEVAFGGAPPSAAELGAGVNGKNDTGSGKYLDAEYRGGRLWATRNTACNLGGGEAESCVDWVQVDVSGAVPVLEQQQTGGAYGSSGDFRYYPDLSVDRNGGIAIGYTKSSVATYTQIWVTGREFSDPPGTLQSETLLHAGLGNYTDGGGCNGSCDRWGDYTGMVVDPDGCTFWYIGEYSDGGYSQWATHIGSFRFASCSTDSAVQVDKGTYSCSDAISVTVTDSLAVDAATVSAQTTVTTTGGDAETIPAGAWTGSDCSDGACTSWTASRPVTGSAGTPSDGTVNAGDGQTITVRYLDPHPGHAVRSVDAAVGCKTRLEDGGYLTTGGCEGGQGGERYRDYMDGGEYISYSFGIYNPSTAPALTDAVAEFFVTGPAADKVTVFNPTVSLGAIGRGQLTAPVFSLYIDPSIDAAGLRLSDHAFNLRITSAADGLTVPQVLSQHHYLQADDTIVNESQCWNFEAGPQGFVHAPIQDDYICSASECGGQTLVTTTAAPWTHGSGCGSETRADDPLISCDTAGSSAFKTNAGAGTCSNFTQTNAGGVGTITDDVLYSPIFGPAHTGSAPSGQPWYFEWRSAEWYFRSDMISLGSNAMAVGFNWDRNYPGVATPAVNEVYDFYPYGYGYLVYSTQSWVSGTPWNNDNPPRNRDGVNFIGATGLATAGLQWRWAIEAYDTDYGRNPLHTPATPGLSLDNLSLSYVQYHASGQVGACQAPAAVVSFDRYSYLQCPSQSIGVSVLDAAATGAVQVTVTSETTSDSETFLLFGAGPVYTASLPSSTGAGARTGDGTLLVAPSDTIVVSYHDGSGLYTNASARVDCEAGDVVVEGLAGLSDNGDHDGYADTNEVVNVSIRLRNNTGQPLENVRAVIDSTDPTVSCISKKTASFGTIPAGGTGTNSLASDPFTFKVSGSVACSDPLAPPTASFRVLILADGFAGPQKPQEVMLLLDLNDLPGTVTFSEPFTSSPAGFVHTLGPGDDDGAAADPNNYACSPYADRFFWRGTGGNPGGGYFCWQNPADNFPAGNYGNLSDSVLLSPVFKIGASGTALTFDHEYLFGYQGSLRADGARVDYRINGGVWRKLPLPYDGGLIWNTYCNPLCNGGGELGDPCYSESAGSGELVFNQLASGVQNWKPASGTLTGLTPGDLVQFRWRVGSMNSSLYSISTSGGYGLDNVTVTNVVQQTCDATARADVGCGVVFDHTANLAQVCGDGDALVEPTERWSVDVTLRNSGPGPAVNTRAALTASPGSRNGASVGGNPASFGTIPAAGGTATASYEFVVAPGADCIENVTFDLTSVTDSLASYADEPAILSVPIGGTGAQQTATQQTSPLLAEDALVASPLLPALTIPAPVYSATLSYAHDYTNVSPNQTEPQATDPLTAENGPVTSLLGAPFAISPATAVSAVVTWTTLSHQNVTNCTKVYLRTPVGFNWTLKDFGAAPANPYDVLSIYKNANGGAGQYQIGLDELSSGPCKQQATLGGATMSVTDKATTGSWTSNARVTLSDGTNAWLIKNYGAADGSPYDISAIYDASGPRTYSIRVEENDAGGQARLSASSLTVTGIQCDAGCGLPTPAAPPVADGTTGSPALFANGPGAGNVTVTIDNSTCSSRRAVVVWGAIGDYSSYRGAVTGCDIGTGPTATVAAPAGSVWFNVLWVNDAGEAGDPGSGTSGPRTWRAQGLCGVIGDDPADAVCN